MLARQAKAYGSAIVLAAHGRTADARSVVAIMALGVRPGDELTVQSSGEHLEQAIGAIVAGLEEAGRLESAHEAAPASVSAHAPVRRGAGRLPQDGELMGVAAVPGFAVGRATRIERREIEVIENGAGIAHEGAELDRARSNVRVRLERMRNAGGAARHEIIAAHLEFLDDPKLNERATMLIGQGKEGAGFAWRDATRGSIAALEALDDARLRERADDLLDIEAHVLLALAGEARPLHLPLPERAVLIADDLLPSELTALDRRRLVAIALGGGGATSHVAILAAAMEVPMLIGLGTELRQVPDGQTVIVDADNGLLQSRPSAEAAATARSTRRSEICPLRSAAPGGAARMPCARWHSCRGVCESGQCRRRDGRGRKWRGRVRAVAHRIPVHRSGNRAGRGRATAGVSKHCRGPRGSAFDTSDDGCGRR